MQVLERAEAEAVPVVVPKRRRRFRVVLVKAFLMVGLAMGLSVSLVVTTPSNAQAVIIPPIAPPIVAGAVTGALPLAAWVGAVTPVGWVVLGTVALAAGLYYTQDYWLPYAKGAFGMAEADKPSPAPGSGVGGVRAGLRLLACTDNNNCPAVVSINAYVYQLNLHYGGTDTVNTYRSDGLAATIRCREPNGNLYTDKKSFTVVYGTNPSDGANWNDREAPVQIACRSVNDTKLGVTAGVHGGSIDLAQVGTTSPTNLLGPENIISYGDLLGQAFDPNSPQTKYTSTVECIKSDGTKFNLSAESTGDQKAVKVPSCAAAVPGSHATGKTTVIGTPPAGSGAPAKTLYTTPAITGTPYPKCEPGVPGNGCVLSISIDGKPCVIGDWQCSRWSELKTEAPARLQCNYGPYVGIAIDTCNPLERAYETGGAPSTQENTDGNPSTRNDTDPAGNPINKPAEGTGTGTGTSGFPSAGTNPAAEPGPDNENCLATGWSWDPVSWVMVPVQCAMQWAFVPPRARLDATVEAIKPRIEAKGIEPFIVPFMTNFGNLGGSGCQGPAISLNAIGLNRTLYPFDACTEPLAPIASGVNAFFSLSIILQGGTSCIRAAAAAFGFNWGLGVGGKDDD